MPKHEKSVERHFESQRIVHFLPTYERLTVWKNRQLVRTKMPLFSRYVFAKFTGQECAHILKIPGVLRIAGTEAGPLPIPDAQIEFLSTSVIQERVTPCTELAVGERFHIKKGPMAGIEGILVRGENDDRFILTLPLIQRSVSIEMKLEDLEPSEMSPELPRKPSAGFLWMRA